MNRILLVLITLLFPLIMLGLDFGIEISDWNVEDFIGFDSIGDTELDVKGGDISSAFTKKHNDWLILRINIDDLSKRDYNTFQTVENYFQANNISLSVAIDNYADFRSPILIGSFQADNFSAFLLEKAKETISTINLDYNMIILSVKDIDWSENKLQTMHFKFSTYWQGRLIDEFITDGSSKDTGNCAFVHHGNQGLTYTEVFRGEYPQDDCGFDEVLEIHQYLQIPGNFHMSGTLITAAAWHDPDFNAWLNTGIDEGWVAMLTSAYAQHIMPFVDDNMNRWAVQTQKDLVQYYYNYNAKVAWIPERVWLANGYYPDAGVVDPWLGDNWTDFGIEAVILDDWPHCENLTEPRTKITWMNNGSGIVLRVIPINGSFTGNVNYDPDAAKSQIASTDYNNIVVYGTDWEVVAEMNEHHNTDRLENYTNVLWYCHDNYPGVQVWKLDEAINNSNFDQSGIDLVKGTYAMLGGTDGYGGGNNSWYIDWASTGSHSDFHYPQWDYGTVWNTTFDNLMTCPQNIISELGWLVMMTNLHETGWHTSGEIADWIHRYSSHIKNANVYAEASRWADGQYANSVDAFITDIDMDGGDELVIHNDRIYLVFEGIGGKVNWLFIRDGLGGCTSVVGSDNVYWSETDGDYNETTSNNHFAALSDVSPNYQHNIYSFVIDTVTVNNDSAQVSLYYGVIHKEIRIKAGRTYAEVIYYAGDTDVYVKSGWTPDYWATIWDPNWERIWDYDIAYMGQRNANTGYSTAYVLNNGGAYHNGTFEGTLVIGDEIYGYDHFKFLLFAGWTDTVYSELNALKSINLDEFPPVLYSPAQPIDSYTVQLNFSEAVDSTSATDTTNYTLADFSHIYCIDYITRMSDWSKVQLHFSTPLFSGDQGNIIVSNVQDLNGNSIADSSVAVLTVPSGATPHLIFIDGVNDFDFASELIKVNNDDTLFITWDADKLYIGYTSFALDDSGDFFVNIDTDQTDSSGATTGSWGRVDFANPFLPEYQVAIEGGPGSIQLNYWDGDGWNYPGANGCESYNGWTDNGLTEISIPWTSLSNPTGIAISVHITEEDNLIVTNAFPSQNSIGNNPTFSYIYQYYIPHIAGAMPLMGYQPNQVSIGGSAELSAPQDVVISVENGIVNLSWDNVDGAGKYYIYRDTIPDFQLSGTLLDSTTTNSYQDSTAIGIKYFYKISAGD